MKKFLFSIVIVLVYNFASAQALNLTIKIEGIKNSKGNLLIGLYDNGSNFPDKMYALAGKILPIKGKSSVYTFENLKPGKYAVAIIHDEDNDGAITTNFIGIPKESFGFSNNVIGTFGPPSFEKASLQLKEDLIITIKLKY